VRPTNQGTQDFTVQVSDSQTPPATATANLSLTINGPTADSTVSMSSLSLDFKTVPWFCRPAAHPLTAPATFVMGS